jgi:hypothetical protein
MPGSSLSNRLVSALTDVLEHGEAVDCRRLEQLLRDVGDVPCSGLFRSRKPLQQLVMNAQVKRQHLLASAQKDPLASRITPSRLHGPDNFAMALSRTNRSPPSQRFVSSLQLGGPALADWQGLISDESRADRCDEREPRRFLMGGVLGRIERQVLDTLNRHTSLNGSVVVIAIAGSEPSRGERGVIQRALARLERKGYVKSVTGPDGLVWSRTSHVFYRQGKAASKASSTSPVALLARFSGCAEI